MGNVVLRALTVIALVVGLGACAGERLDENTEVAQAGELTNDPAGADQMSPRMDAADGGFADWDTDTQAGVDETEFTAGFGNAWNDWDANRDARWDADEAAGTFWTRWDANDDERLDQNEWNEGVRTWGFQNGDYGTWADWDANNDSYLDQQEFGRGFETKAWDDWDADGDGAVGRDEVADTYWDWFDGNDDNLIDENEWGSRSRLWS